MSLEQDAPRGDQVGALPHCSEEEAGSDQVMPEAMNQVMAMEGGRLDRELEATKRSDAKYSNIGQNSAAEVVMEENSPAALRALRCAAEDNSSAYCPPAA
jgi:hypothetical protein